MAKKKVSYTVPPGYILLSEFCRINRLRYGFIDGRIYYQRQVPYIRVQKGHRSSIAIPEITSVMQFYFPAKHVKTRERATPLELKKRKKIRARRAYVKKRRELKKKRPRVYNARKRPEYKHAV